MDTETVVTISDSTQITSTTPGEEKIAQLTAELHHAMVELQAALVRNKDYVAGVAKDFATISDALIDEANRRDWCDEYDDIIAEVNGKLRYGTLRERTRMFKVQVSVKGTVSMTHEIEIEASSQDNANNKVSGDPCFYVDAEEVLSDYVRRYNSFDDTDVEVK